MVTKRECIGEFCCSGHEDQAGGFPRQDSKRHQGALFSAVSTLFDREPPGERNAASTFAWANQQQPAAAPVIRRAPRPSSPQQTQTHTTPDPAWGATPQRTAKRRA